MQLSRFVTLLAALMLVAAVAFCRADPAPPVVRLAAPSRALVRIGTPYRAERRAARADRRPRAGSRRRPRGK